MSIADSLPEEPETNPSSTSSPPGQLQHQHLQVESTLRMVETAFLASTASLIWFINFYFPFGPVLRIFFPIPIALVYLRWGNRAAWMAAVTSGLLLSVLMGPVRSLLFVIPFALMGVLLGATWYRRVSWLVSIVLGTLLGTVGVFFRLWFLSVLSGEDLWVYVINQVTALIEWFFLKFELLMTANLLLIQLGAIALVVLNNIIYLFLVHLTAWLLFDRLGNPIPRPPHWVQVLMDYE
ncbi:DUF2232 domain-containing protein [Cuspidothrix issatschenkoi LEGE 03284]|uniref:DUF2232 domain-containing protein n=1 Tax=Cuspidothrix issatschenkoi TaxID=230752 RepID=UPI00187F54FB|nr:DUF2232 domain-containing protein [Cuspidothrix issatschenkoi]MBE9230619.1 DUF2232 domain-containing protein [Cuspidothrix issatschenkoi LEGE 03284]